MLQRGIEGREAMTSATFTEEDDRKMGMPSALRQRLRQMYGEEFRHGALLIKHINQVDPSYLRDRAESIKKYKKDDAVCSEIKAFVRAVNANLKKEKPKKQKEADG